MTRLTLLTLCAGLALLPRGSRAQAPHTTVGVTSELERTAATSPQEKLRYATSSNVEMDEADKAVARLLEAARKDGDPDAIECLVTRQSALRALTTVSRGSTTSLKDALAAGQAEKANHEFRKIAVALSKGRMLLAEARRCVSSRSVASGSTIVDWTSALTSTVDLSNESISPFDISFELDEGTNSETFTGSTTR